MQGTKAAIKETGRELPHILVVDDEKSICELLEITFRKEGHRVEVANSVEGAKRKLESQIFDIIISDIRMPGEDGVDLLKFAKEIAPDSFFVLMTALPALDTAIAALNSGADRYVIKDHNHIDQLRRLPAPGTAPPHRAGQYYRAKPENARHLRFDSDGCAPVQSRAYHRRERNG
jgi:DNA-binding NtrC family response regulator